MRNIVVTKLPIQCDREEVFAKSERKRPLINVICKYANRLRQEGVEVFARKDNVIATEKGYYLAFYEDELDQINQNEELEQQFTGEDGRLKVKLMDKEGGEHIEDVAELVAKSFIPNPLGHKFVKFKDGNPVNCNKSNLYWSDTQ